MISATLVLMAVLLDQMVGELSRWHPLVGFGILAHEVEHRLTTPQAISELPIITRLKGVLAVLLTCLPFAILANRLSLMHYIGPVFSIIILYLAIGAKSLQQHARAVAGALAAGDLNTARAKVSLMVSRETSAMQETDVAKAAIESVLENGNDAIFGTLFWYLLGGAGGAVLYRLVNTLDAMWGYKTPRYHNFGWAAARSDDLLNFIPARLTALTYTLLGNRHSAWQCWRTQAHGWYSPNAGPVMAAGAGALSLQLGGPATYNGVIKDRPILGESEAPRPGDIERAIELVQKGLWLWVFISFLGAFVHA